MLTIQQGKCWEGPAVVRTTPTVPGPAASSVWSCRNTQNMLEPLWLHFQGCWWTSLVGFNRRDVGTIVAFSLMPVAPPKPTGIMHVLGYASRMFSTELQWNAAQCLSSPWSGFFSWSLPYSPENLGEVKATPKAENSILKTYIGKAWNVEHQGCGDHSFEVARSPWPLPSACTLGTQGTLYRGDHQGDKENKEFTCSPTFPGRPRFPGSPCRTRDKGTWVTWGCQPDLSTTWLFVHPLFGLQICEKQHLTKPAVTWRIIQSKKHHWHKHGANTCCSGAKCPRSWSWYSKITSKEPHWNIRYLLLCDICPA